MDSLTTSNNSKVCTGCKELKPFSDYAKHRTGRFGLRPQCRACHRDYYLANREKILSDHREYWKETRSDRKASRIRYQYGITIEEYEQIQAQGCAICGAMESTGRSSSMHVDHDHSCCPGKRSCGQCVRGVLCTSCNQGLGRFKDDPDRLVAAAIYLESFQ